MTIGPGVEPERIMRESFVSPVPKNAHAETLALEEGVAVEFGRSGKACTVRGGQTDGGGRSARSRHPFILQAGTLRNA
jgi:hypothetical protein